jgi:hypothetical protein
MQPTLNQRAVRSWLTQQTNKWLNYDLIMQHWYSEVQIYTYTHGFVDWGRRLQKTPWGAHTPQEKLRCSAPHAATCVAFFGYPKWPGNTRTWPSDALRYPSPSIALFARGAWEGGRGGEVTLRKIKLSAVHTSWLTSLLFSSAPLSQRPEPAIHSLVSVTLLFIRL